MSLEELNKDDMEFLEDASKNLEEAAGTSDLTGKFAEWAIAMDDSGKLYAEDADDIYKISWIGLESQCPILMAEFKLDRQKLERFASFLIKITGIVFAAGYHARKVEEDD